MRKIHIPSLLFLCINLSAQVESDSTSIQAGKKNAELLYETAMEGIHHLYNGSEYIPYEPLFDEHPYYLTDEWTYSELKYDAEWFQNVPILLDIEKGKLIASNYFNGSKMELVGNRVDEFIMDGHRFIQLKNSLDSSEFRTGYYEVLYEGATVVLSKRIKRYNEHIDGLEEVRNFVESNQYFLVHDGLLHRVITKHDILKIMKDQKKPLKSYIRDQHLFTHDRESSIVSLTKYYDSLSK